MERTPIKYPFSRLADVNAPYRDRLVEAMTRVVDSGYYVGGPEVARFEEMLAGQTGAPYAVGVTNGLDALRLILRGWKELGLLRDGDGVIVPANTYVASVLAVTDNRLRPVFCEPDPVTMTLDTARLDEALSAAGDIPVRAVMPVHLYGRLSWDERLVDFVRRHNLLVIEDNAQAIGCRSAVPGLFGSSVTGGLGHAGAFSFYPTKNIGALGDAGAIVTHDVRLAEVCRAIRNYGSRERYHNIYKGLNCRLDPVKAAQLAVKLPYTDAENMLRRERAAIYNRLIDNPLVQKPEHINDGSHVYHQYVVRVADRDRFRDYLLSQGVETAVHYATPPHRQPCYCEYAALHLPVTESIADTCVSLPITRTTGPEDARDIAAIINAWHG